MRIIGGSLVLMLLLAAGALVIVRIVGLGQR